MGASNQPNDSELVSQINITPFVDVVLVLLVIFIVTAPMLVKDILDIRLPVMAKGDGQSVLSLGVAINRSGGVLLDGELVDEETFKTKIAITMSQSPQAQAIVSADVDVAYGKVMHVIDMLKSAGLEKFAVQIEKSKP